MHSSNFTEKKGIFQKQKVSKSVKAKVHHLFVKKSYQLRELKIHKIYAAMEALVYGAEKVSWTKHWQFQVCLNTAQQAATTWSDADRQKAIERLERENHQRTTAKHMVFDQLFQHHESQLMREVATKANGPRSIFAKQLALMKTAAEDEHYRAANMTVNQRLEVQNLIWYAETEATTRSLADTERVTIQLERHLWHHLEWTEGFPEGILHPHDRV